MRRFRVWIDKNEAGSRPWYETIELPDSATDDVCNAACADCLQTMIANELDTGWEEVKDEKEADR